MSYYFPCCSYLRLFVQNRLTMLPKGKVCERNENESEPQYLGLTSILLPDFKFGGGGSPNINNESIDSLTDCQLPDKTDRRIF